MTHSQIEEQFKGIEGINEAKKIYKQLAKKLHPDVGGSDELFKMLNSIYTNILENGIYFSNEFKFDLEIEKIISQILHYENILIEVVGSWVWVSGDTREIKEKLKELNFKWASKKKLWFYGEMKGRNPNEKSMEDIKSKYGFETVKTKEKTEKDKNQEVKDSINKAVKEVQNENTGKPGTDTLGTEPGIGTPNTINGTPGGNGAENGEIPINPENGTPEITVEPPNTPQCFG